MMDGFIGFVRFITFSDLPAFLLEVKSEYENHEDAVLEQVHENNNAPEDSGVFRDESVFQDPLQRNSSISSSKKRSATQNEENSTGCVLTVCVRCQPFLTSKTWTEIVGKSNVFKKRDATIF